MGIGGVGVGGGVSFTHTPADKICVGVFEEVQVHYM